LGRSLVRPVTALAETAHRLGEGDLTVRAQVDGPPEVKAVAQALNGLASRLDDIIEGERQALADLSHRLRTPLTALRLEAERLSTGTASERLLQQVDRTERAVDQLIREVGNRDRTEGRRGRTDLVDVVRRRLDFWSVLAEDQNRTVTAHLHHDPLIVPASESELAAVVDALIENIFTHTPPGTGFEVTVREEAAAPLLVVSDAGPGFGSGDPVERGRSAAGSTGLGLDIARSLAERLGGGIETHEGPGGGALVMVRLG
ncbi:MAG: HAMP domain-containing sensor histidine kinase, partial [Acidimicrobiia bacterium]